LVKADKALNDARQDETAARAHLEAATRAHDLNPTPKTEAALHAAETKLTRAETTRARAETALALADRTLHEAVRTGLGKNAAAHEAEIASLDFARHTITRDIFDVKVGGTNVTLKNGVDSYATVDLAGLQGSAADDTPAKVAAAIDKTTYSASVKSVFKGVSSNEGTFSTINGYDSKGITFGFIQMAGTGPGDTLSNMLAQFKKEHPADFTRTLQRYGIDIERGPRGSELVVHQPDGSTLRGKEAGRKVGTDPQLAAALSAAGTDPAMQGTQLHFAKNYLDNQRGQSIKAGGQEVKISDLITSETGNGILFDRSVHGGLGGARKTLTDVVQTYLETHPKAKLGDENVRADIEKAYIAAISGEKSLHKRCANIAERTSDERGTYVE
jgi:hypothetical protein